jgi:hypothetical protein
MLNHLGQEKLLHSKNWGYNYSLGDGPKASKSECPCLLAIALHIKSKYEPWNFVHFNCYKIKQTGN